MERRKKKQGGGIYLAICCCVVIVAMVGYANRLSLEEEKPEEKIAQQIPVTPEPEAKQTSQKTLVEEDEKPVETKAPTEKPEEKKEEIKFTPPVDGKVIEEYSGDDLVYNEALKDWRAHSGVDFEAKLGDEVKVSARGIVEEVFDSNMGRCVVVDHQNGFKTMYANLEENTRVKEGDSVSAGDVIGMVGNTALGDATDMPHVHFEMMKGEATVNPIEYFE